MKRYDPKRIVDNLSGPHRPEDLALPAQHPLPSSESGIDLGAEGRAPADETAEEEERDRAFESADPARRGDGSVRPFQYLNDLVLPAMEASVHINQIPPGTRFGFPKRLLHRMLRLISAPQVDFNSHASQALRILTQHAETLDRYVGEQVETMRRETEERTQAQHEYVARTGEEMVTKTQAAVQEAQKQMVAETQKAVQEANARLVGETQRVAHEADRRTLETVRASEKRMEDFSRQHLDDLSGKMRQLFGLFQNELRRVAEKMPAPSSPPAVTSPPPARSPSAPSPARAPSSFVDDAAYHVYEDSWRGSAEDIRAWQDEYIQLLARHLEPLPEGKRLVLDAGCGRGEFLRALKEAGYEGKGVDINRVFAEEGRKAGLEVEEADAAAYLERQPDGRFGAIVAFQVLEHLAPAVLRRFIDLVAAKLAPGGVALFETLNPGTFAAYRWYLMDLTHQRFLVPDTLRFACECAGLEHVETRFVHPVAEYEKLRETGGDVERENIRRLNELLFGNQDYLMLVRRPVPADGVREADAAPAPPAAAS
ncbi:MAG TPA: methyltransferase domain-containing protein [Sumerlaeia bacterium]|nr:methyltransferase domain-containing protein [Sumerlaeia bacterium]